MRRAQGEQDANDPAAAAADLEHPPAGEVSGREERPEHVPEDLDGAVVAVTVAIGGPLPSEIGDGLLGEAIGHRREWPL